MQTDEARILARPRALRPGRAAAGVAALTVVLALACSGCGSTSDEETTPTPLPIGEWTSIVSGKWALAPGEEKYVCMRHTLAEAIEVTGFRPDSPVGTHHTMLTIADHAGADGVSDCDGGTNGQVVLFASGYGTSEIQLPEGTAVSVPAGTQLLLNVHLLNTSNAAVAGETGATALLLDPADVLVHAEVKLAGKVGGLEVVPGASTQTGTCTFIDDSTLYAVMPHMHARGVHMSVTAKQAGGDVSVIDIPFDVDDQHYRLADPPLAMKKGEKLEVVCGYENTTQETYVFGPHSTDEMCYGIFFRYPALGGSAVCTE